MRLTRATWVRLCVVVALVGATFALTAAPAPAVAFHGITPRKACNLFTKIGDPYVCAYQIINADDNNEDVVVTGLSDVVHAASGNVGSGNIIGAVTWTPSGGATCTGTPVTSCKLPNKGDAITSADFTFYTVQPGDYSQNPQHILADDILVNWSEPVCVMGSCPVGGQTGTTGASTTVQNFKPSINTQLVPAGPVAIGTPVHDTSTLTNASATAGGTVSYAVYSNNTCTTLVQALGTKTVTNGVVPDSDVWTPNAAGNYWFQASYSGDASNDPAVSACTSEPITVNPNTPSINTQLVPAGPVAIGTPIHDTSTLTGATANAGGSVTYAVYSANTCAPASLIQTLGTKTVTNGVVPDSDTYTPQSAGNLWFQATYSGDANNTGPVSSACLSEPMTVSPNTPSINTQLVPAGPVAIGTPVHDTSSLTGATANAGGTVSYAVYSNNTCTTLVQALGTKTVTNGVVPDSDVWTPNAAGNYWFQATYSGDANNTGPVSSACTSEPITVNPNTPSITTQLVPAGPVAIGTAVHDTAQLQNVTANAGGTVSYAVYSNNTCTTLVQALGTKTVTNGVVPDSDVWTPNAAGNYWFQATYSGDANNTGPVSSACTSEPITVNPNTPTVATQLVPAGPVAIGTPVHDTAQISGATANAMGTVSFAVYSNNTCTTLVQNLGSVAVVNGVPNGPSNDFTPNAAGNYWFQATYSGDVNNTGPVKSVCTTELLVVNPNTPGITTQLVPPGPVNVGTAVHDTAQLQNVTANAGGTVSYAVYSNNTCTTLVQALGTKTVTNGAVPDSDVWTAGPPGSYWFQATYSGDANNAGPVKSACTSEPITVNGNTPLHFQCYETKTTGFAPKTVTVVDQFGSYSPVLSQLHKLCNPANKNNEDPNAVNSDTHLDGYPASAKDSPGGGHKVQTTDQFGTFTLTLAQLKTVMVPSAKSLVGPVGPLASPAVDRLACYVVRSAAGFTARMNVQVQDEFGTLTLNVGPVDEYCNPINLNGKEPGAQNHTTTYVCYDTDIPTSSPAFKPPANVWVNDEFQAFKPVLDGHVWELCVPGTSKVVG